MFYFRCETVNALRNVQGILTVFVVVIVVSFSVEYLYAFVKSIPLRRFIKS